MKDDYDTDSGTQTWAYLEQSWSELQALDGFCLASSEWL